MLKFILNFNFLLRWLLWKNLFISGKIKKATLNPLEILIFFLLRNVLNVTILLNKSLILVYILILLKNI
jgi:hypothetical protein